MGLISGPSQYATFGLGAGELNFRRLQTGDRPYRLFDGDGLYLEVRPNGARYWRFKYRIAGKEKRLAFGVYPDVSLADARERRAQARKIVGVGCDPAEIKKEAKRLARLKAENTFESIALEWRESRKHKWATSYYEALIARFDRHLFPRLGNRSITEITAPEFLSVVRVVEKSGSLDLAQRLLQVSGQIFQYAISTGRAERNPLDDLRGALQPRVKKHQAYLKENELPEYLLKLKSYDGHPQTKLALKFLLLTYVRTSELRAAERSEINLEKAEWRIPAERMKMREMHIVPLSRQAVSVLEELKGLTGGTRFVFSNQHRAAGCMSENTMLHALYRMGYHSKATGHGFRATASTILNENGLQPSVIERQLAHAERNGVRAAYNHAEYLPERRKMMQWWADYLDEAATKR